MRRIAQIGIIGCWLSCLASWPTLAETRVALVIGNGAYQKAPPLANPVNDARGIVVALRRLDFRVEEGIDLDMMAMRKALRDFAELLDGADVGLVYYAGHALQVRGRNYLLPIDADPERESDLIFQAVDLGLVLRLLEENPRTSVVFLDACRNNPLANSLARSLGRERSQSVGQGLAGVESGIGTLIAYATQPDNVALDGNGEHSPFTEALLKHIETPDLEIRQMLSRVRRTVIDATLHRQVPWDHSSLTGDFYFDATRPHDDGYEPVPPPAVAVDMVVWKVIRDSRDPADFEIFLQNYPGSPFTPFARGRLAELKGAPVPPEDEPLAGLAPSIETQEAAVEVGQSAAGTVPAPPPAPLVTAPEAAEPAPVEPSQALVEIAALPRTAPPDLVPVALPVLIPAPIEPALEPPEPEPTAVEPPAPEPTAPEPTAAEPTAPDRARAAELALGLSRNDWRALQHALNALGHPAGPEDGRPGQRTRAALQVWQQAAGSDPSGYLDGREQIRALRTAALESGSVAVAGQPPSTSAPVSTKRSPPGPAVGDCDRLAGDPTDPQRGDRAVAWQELDARRAVAACAAAVEQQPDEPRLEHQYGRALLKAGRFEGAVRWLRAAATQGYGAAQRQVGDLYMISAGVPRDEAQAVIWYRKAAEQGDPGAQYLLGMSYAIGRGVARDDAAALTWLSRAAEQGDAGAQYILGWIYRAGRGVQPDLALAAHWYREAAQHGDHVATVALDLLN